MACISLYHERYTHTYKASLDTPVKANTISKYIISIYNEKESSNIKIYQIN